MRQRQIVAAQVFLTAFMSAGSLQRGTTLPQIKSYPGSVEFCRGHDIGAPQGAGKPGFHLQWTAYHSADPQQKVVDHYLQALGARNHREEENHDVWRFPLDQPDLVLSVAPAAAGTLPSNTCKGPPENALTVVIISSIARP